jgi:hypothetical protein
VDVATRGVLGRVGAARSDIDTWQDRRYQPVSMIEDLAVELEKSDRIRNNANRCPAMAMLWKSVVQGG